MNKITVSLVFILALVLFYVGGQSLALSIHVVGTEAAVSGGTNLWAIAGSVILIALVWLVFDEKAPRPTQSIPSPSRRLLAAFMDYLMSFLAILGLLGFLPALGEWVHTSEFHLHFDRSFVRPTDTFVGMILGLLWLAFAVFYFGYPARKGKQTVGNYLAGTILVSTSHSEISWARAFGRMLLSWVAIAAFIVTLILGRDKQGRYWHDKATDTNVLRTP